MVVAHSRSECLCDIANSGAIGRFNFRGRRTVGLGSCAGRQVAA